VKNNTHLTRRTKLLATQGLRHIRTRPVYE